MDNQTKLSVVLPAYQEEENLRLLLPRIAEELGALKITSEVLVIDTQDPLDDSQRVCEQWGARLIPRQHGDAYGDAVRTGINSSQGEYIIFMDADGSHSPEWIPRLYEHSIDKDVVIASRYVEHGYTENSIALIAMSRFLNFTYSTVLGIKCKDISNSYRLYRAQQMKSLHLTCNNFDIVEEVLLKLSRKFKPLRILEIPFTFKQRLFGKSKRNLVVFMFTYLYTLMKLRFFS
jgi:dolichol-phosphate mannosyltransferase